MVYSIGSFLPNVNDTSLATSRIMLRKCILNSEFNLTDTCYSQITTFYAPGLVSTKIDPTTTFGTFYITLQNNKGATVDNVCSKYLMASAFLYVQEEGILSI